MAVSSQTQRRHVLMLKPTSVAAIAMLMLFVGASSAVPLRRMREVTEDAVTTSDIGTQIVGGVDVEDKDRFPYMVNLRSTGYGPKYCGGSLIAPNVVLSAAHCFGAESVTIGKWDFSLDQPEDFDLRTVAEQIMHPGYDSSSMENDIMLIRLSEPSTKRPVAINLDGQANLNQMLNVQGWGTLSSGGSQPDRLQEVGVDFVSNSACNSNYGGSITSDMMCASSPNKDSCQGDSGGPLIIKGSGAEADMQVGVVSWGYGCADPNYPGVYARVNTASPFIEQTLSGWGVDITNPSPGPTPPQLSPTQQFSSTNPFDMSFSSITFSAQSYEPCRSTGITSFPEDPSGSTTLALGDDDSAEISFSGGFTFNYFGIAYSSAHIGSNGYVTFGSGDTNYGASLDAHFSKPRISALFDDLSPGAGSVSWKQLQDRVIITYTDVPIYGRPDDKSTFQVILDGSGSVTLTYLNVADRSTGTTTVVGLSGGNRPAGWESSDLSASSACLSPSPPATAPPTTPPPTTNPPSPTPGTPPPSTTTLECAAPGELKIQHLSSSILVTCVTA